MPTDPIAGLMKDLTYINYAANRDSFPQKTPESWKRIFGDDVEWMEERYQRELPAKVSAYAAAGMRKDQHDRLEGRDDNQTVAEFALPV